MFRTMHKLTKSFQDQPVSPSFQSRYSTFTQIRTWLQNSVDFVPVLVYFVCFTFIYLYIYMINIGISDFVQYCNNNSLYFFTIQFFTFSLDFSIKINIQTTMKYELTFTNQRVNFNTSPIFTRDQRTLPKRQRVESSGLSNFCRCCTCSAIPA